MGFGINSIKGCYFVDHIGEYCRGSVESTPSAPNMAPAMRSSSHITPLVRLVPWFRVWGLAFRVEGSGFGVKGFRV